LSQAPKSHPARGNHLLSHLSEEAYAAIAALLQPAELAVKQVLYERGNPLSPYIYFPVNCGISAILPMQDGAAVEVGTVGNEGFCAVEVLTGADACINTYICQVPGQALRMSVADFMHALDKVPELSKLTRSYFQGYMSQVTQSVACNRLHSVEMRFARWMLITHDRVQGDEFELTQEFIAEMLGAQCPSVSLVAGQFQKAGLIQYSGGHMRILNRAGLEDTACECYFDVRDQFQRLLGVRYG
jgi:CRP-like cAMP-binding protein